MISFKNLTKNIRSCLEKTKKKFKGFFKKKKRIYIINNYPGGYKPERIIRLENIIRLDYPELDVKTIHYTEIERKEIKKSIGIILTGSSLNVSSFSKNPSLKESFKSEVDLIKNEYKNPILAICFGHQLAAYAFGAEVKRMSYRAVHNDIFKLYLDNSDDLISSPEVRVNLNHKDYIVPYDKELRKHFKIIANLDVDGYKTVQYMKHKKKPIYSVQFHPENHIANYHYPPYVEDDIIDEAKIVGQIIISNFISLCF